MPATTEDPAVIHEKRGLCCVRCGYLDEAPGGACPHCHEAALDLADPADYAIAKYVVPARRVRREWTTVAYAWGALAAIVGLDIAFYYGYSLYLSQPLGLMVFYIIKGIRRRRQRIGLRQLEKDLEPKHPRLAWRVLTSAPILIILAMVGCLLVFGLPGEGAAHFAVSREQQLGDAHNIFYYPFFVYRSLVWHAMFLMVFGLPVDLRVSRSATLLIFLTATALGAAVHITWSTGELFGPVVGIVALAAAQLAVMPRRRQSLGLFIPGPAWLITPLLTVLYLAYEGFQSGLSVPACAAGAVVGFIGGALCRKLPESIHFVEFNRRIVEGLKRAEG